MINSLKHNKNTNEDPKTSTIFELLMLLPDDIFWDIIRDSSHNKKDKLPSKIGFLEHYDFWPQWNPNGTDNKRYVEPDLFFRFSKYDFIVEAKYNDDTGQDPSEWEREVIAYSNEYLADNKQVILLAVGGNKDYSEEYIDIEKKNIHCKVLKYKWADILQSTLKAKETYLKKVTNYYFSSLQRIFNLIEEGFHIMGINSHKKTALSSLGNINSLIVMFEETCNRETPDYILKKHNKSSSSDYFNYHFKVEFNDNRKKNISLSLQMWFKYEVITIAVNPSEDDSTKLLIKMIKDKYNFTDHYLKTPYKEGGIYYFDTNDTFKVDFSKATSFDEQLTILKLYVDELIENYIKY